MVGSLTEQLDNLYTSTWQHMRDTVADQVFAATPFFFWMKEKGKLKKTEGGRFLTEPLEYEDNETVTWIGRGGTVSLNDYEFLTVAKYDWRYLVASIVRFGVDDQQNRGKSQIINLMTAKFNNTQNSLISQLETALFAGSGAATNAIDGLQLLVADNPSASVEIGGINQATYPWWANQAENLTGKSFATNGEMSMRTMLNNCGKSRGNDTPDIIVSGQTPFEWYEDALLPYYRIQNNKLGDAGFHNIMYKGIPMVWSPACANTRMYFLNTKYLYIQYDPAMWFDMTDWKAIPDQVNDRAAQIICALSFTTSRRKVQGVIYNIDTA